MAHEADGGLAVVKLGGGVHDRLHDGLEILVAGQQRLADGDLLKRICIGGQLGHDIVVLQAIHQMGGLHHERFDAVGHSAVQRLGHVIDDLAVAGLDVINDDLAGKAAAHGIIREGLLHGGLDGPNGQAATIVVAGTEADDQQLVFADIVRIAGIVQRGVAGFVVLFLLRQNAQAGEQQHQYQQHGKQLLHTKNLSFEICEERPPALHMNLLTHSDTPAYALLRFTREIRHSFIRIRIQDPKSKTPPCRQVSWLRSSPILSSQLQPVIREKDSRTQ